MKIELSKNNMIIVPETDFETEWLQCFEVGKVFHKTGLTPADYIGLKIRRKDSELEDNK